MYQIYIIIYNDVRIFTFLFNLQEDIVKQSTRLLLFISMLAGTTAVYGCGNDSNSGNNEQIQCEPACQAQWTCDTTVGQCVCPEGLDCSNDNEQKDPEDEKPKPKECTPECTGKYKCNTETGACYCPVGENCDDSENNDGNDDPGITVPCSEPDADGDTIADKYETELETQLGLTPNTNDEDSDGD
ncbi:MAG: hypothetical protein J6S69_03775, partial [Proteobacteria bacterium]|nr:hypothetical protein [Pseudomonadota bacterium]